MTQVAQPSISVAITPADSLVENTAQKVLLVGQMTSVGTASSGDLVQNLASTGAPETCCLARTP